MMVLRTGELLCWTRGFVPEACALEKLDRAHVCPNLRQLSGLEQHADTQEPLQIPGCRHPHVRRGC